MRSKCHWAPLLISLILWSQGAPPVLADPTLSLDLKAASLTEVLAELQKHSDIKLRAAKDIARQKVHLFAKDVTVSEVLEKLCALRGYEIKKGKDEEKVLQESDEHHARVRARREEARSLRLRKLKERVAEVQAALKRGDSEALRQRDPDLALYLNNGQWNAQIGLLLQLSPQQLQTVMKGGKLGFRVWELPPDIQEMFLDAVGRMKVGDAAGNVEWSTDILREVGKVEFVQGGPPQMPTLYMRVYTGGGPYVPPWHSINILRPHGLGIQSSPQTLSKEEQGKDDPRLQKPISLEQLVYRKDDSGKQVAYWAKFEELLQQLREKSGLNILATCHRDVVPYGPEDVRQRDVYLHEPLKDMPVWKVLNILASYHYYTWQRDGEWILFQKQHEYLFND